ncbi:hypothetical protein LCGC14_2987740, partial [marine sediment metagenome]
NKEVIEGLEKQNQPLIERAAAAVVKCQQDADDANQQIDKMKKALKLADNTRLGVVRNILAARDAINNLFRPLTENLDGAIRVLKDKVLGWRKEEQDRIAEENRKAMEKQQKELERRQNISKAQNGDGEAKTSVAAPVEQVFEDTTKVKKVWKHTVVDAQAVPREYLEVNETKIRRAMQDHIDPKTKLLNPEFKIAGVEFNHVEQM